MASSQLLASEEVPDPLGRKIRVLFYEDGSIRMRVGGSGAHAIKGDFALTEAYLQGGDHKIIKIAPLSSM